MKYITEGNFVVGYISTDGVKFNNERDCVDHEVSIWLSCLLQSDNIKFQKSATNLRPGNGRGFKEYGSIFRTKEMFREYNLAFWVKPLNADGVKEINSIESLQYVTHYPEDSNQMPGNEAIGRWLFIEVMNAECLRWSYGLENTIQHVNKLFELVDDSFKIVSIGSEELRW